MIRLNTPNFSSGYATNLYEFVEAKRRDGFKYNSEVKELQRLDRYLKSHGITPESCSEEEVICWLAKRPSESEKTFSTRNSVYRQFYKHLQLGHDFVLPAPPNAREKLHGGGFTPYIFTHEEIQKMLDATDSERVWGATFARCAPLLFRLLYGTGLRINEAISLTVADISIKQELLLIRETKNDNSRLVPMSKSLTHRLTEYLAAHGYSKEEPLFQNKNQRQISSKTAYEWFRLILRRVGIPHRGRGNGPRMHDVRHTFSVHSLQAAVERGTDPNAFLPLLCVYLGHRHLSATERYLRLTAEAFPSVQRDMDLIMDSIIPEVAGYEG